MKFGGGLQVELDRLARDFEQQANDFPSKRARVIGKIGTELEAEVQKRVPVENGFVNRGGSGEDGYYRGYKNLIKVKDRRPRGTIRDAQVRHIGSGGGYVAIRPREGIAPQNSGSRRDSYRLVTGALEVGHGTTGSTEATNQFVVGRYFYRQLQGKNVRVAEEIAKKHLDALRQELVEEMNR